MAALGTGSLVAQSHNQARDQTGRGPTEASPQAPVEVPASTLLQRLGQRDLPTDEARRIAGDLQTRPIGVRIALFDAVRRAYGERCEQHGKTRERLQKEFAKAAAATQRTSLQHTGAAKLDQLRKQAATITARQDLTKEAIHAELDPLLAELRSCVLPTAQQVLDQDPALATAVAAYLGNGTQVEQWYDLCLEAAHHVDGDPTGRAHAQKAAPLAPPPLTLSIDVEFEAACVLGLQLSSQDQRALEDNEALRASMDPAEFQGTLELNRIRMALGLNAVRIDQRLGVAARDHSRDMHTLGFFSHTSPVDGKHSFGDRASRAGTSASAENIAAGQSRGEGAIEAWWYSPGHHKNMLGGHARTGLGRYGQTWTQLFGG